MSILDYQEFVVKRNMEGSLKALRGALLFLYTVPPLLLCAVLAFYQLYPMILIVFLLTLAVEYLTWPLTHLEYEYVTDGLTLSFVTIRGHSSRREVLRLKRKEMSAIVPASEENVAKWDRSIARRYDFRSSAAIEHAYLAVFQEDGKRYIVYFDGFRQLIETIRFRNAPITTMRDGLPIYE